MYKWIEYSNNHSKTLGILWQSFRDEPAVNCNGAIVEFNEVNPTKLFNSIANVKDQTGNNDKNDAEVMAPLTYLNNFWRTLEIALINFEINLFLTWYVNYILVCTTNTNEGVTFSKTDTNFYFPVCQLKIKQNYYNN